MSASWVELFVVADVFAITGRGLVLAPGLAYPPSGWKNRTESIRVSRPDGTAAEFEAHFWGSHFLIRGAETSAADRWRVEVVLPEAAKDQVPAGSRIFAAAELARALGH